VKDGCESKNESSKKDECSFDVAVGLECRAKFYGNGKCMCQAVVATIILAGKSIPGQDGQVVQRRKSRPDRRLSPHMLSLVDLGHRGEAETYPIGRKNR
jgi:hypothetical protein